MNIMYQNTDITGLVQVKSCMVTDTCGARCDSLDIVFENAAGWYRWGPKEDDQVIVSQDGYDTGIMYVNTVLPEDGKYRIYATALPCTARVKGYRSFQDKTIDEIMRICARETGMDYRLYGVNGDIVIPYIQRNGESCAAFLFKLLALEGALLKCVNGRYTAIGIEYAQDRDAYKGFRVTAEQRSAYYSRAGVTCKSLTVQTPYAQATAEDTAVDSTHMRKIVNDLPALNNVQAGRWARNKLLLVNRCCESLLLQADYDPLVTALARIDITGGTDADGQWIVEKAEHDLINLKTSIKAHRCLRTIQ